MSSDGGDPSASLLPATPTPDGSVGFAISASPPLPSEKKNTDLDRVKSVFREQFALELSYKEGELELIEERIQLAKVLLQRLRLGVLAQHYGAAAFFPTTLDYRTETTGVQDSWEEFELEYMKKERCDENMGQVGGHELDAEDEMKVLLSPSSANDQGVEDGSRIGSVLELDERERDSCHEDATIDDSIMEKRPLSPTPVSREHPVATLAPGRSTQLQPKQEEDEDEGKMSRFYRKKRIIVGNTSQYLDPIAHQHISADGSTHKWMVYVRGPQAEPDISHFVKAVRFFLHPSYHPNDIVQVCSPPFHLTRHGWGEFPVRVQLEFQDVCNKSVDILHNLVLDRTHTGQQTLGAETVVDLDISALPGQQSLQVNGLPEVRVKKDQNEGNMASITEAQPLNSSSASSISLPSYSSVCSSFDSSRSSYMHCTSVSQCLTNKKEEGKKQTVQTPQSSECMMSSGKAANGGVGGVITTNLDKCLHTAVRSIPICGHPLPSEHFYIPAPSLAQFRMWSIGRRRATEWVRAVAVKQNIQRKLRVPSLLSTKRVMQWCRQNGYTPLDAIPETGRGFCKICGRQLEMDADGMEDEGEGKGYDEESEFSKRRNLEVHEHCHSMLFGPGSYLRDGLLDVYEDIHVYDSATEIDKSVPHRPKLSLLGQPLELIERLFTLEQRFQAHENMAEEDVDTTHLPPSPSCARSRALVDIVPRFRVPQTPELKWIQRTASSVGIRIFPAVIDRMYAHVIEHMMYVSCTRFLRGILGQAIQGAWQGEEGCLSQDRILTPFHLQQAILKLEHCDFLTNRYLGAQACFLGGGGIGGSCHTSSTGSSSDTDTSSDEEGEGL